MLWHERVLDEAISCWAGRDYWHDLVRQTRSSRVFANGLGLAKRMASEMSARETTSCKARHHTVNIVIDRECKATFQKLFDSLCDARLSAPGRSSQPLLEDALH